MTSKGPRSKLDHETRARRQKALEAPREPCRPRTHWDHVLEEMVWLSKDFESERKWKLALAKKVALRASKGMLDQATKGERRVKEEEQRLRKVALNISKDIKKFWMKIEKLVLHKLQLEIKDKKKKVQDKQLEFLLGQTERYSTMLAENLVDAPTNKMSQSKERVNVQCQEVDEKDNNVFANSTFEPLLDHVDADAGINVPSKDKNDKNEDDVHSIDEDETLMTKEERQKELAALQCDADLPLAALLECYAAEEVCRKSSLAFRQDAAEPSNAGEATVNDLGNVDGTDTNNLAAVGGRRCMRSDDRDSSLENHLSDVKSCWENNPRCDKESVINHAQYEPSDDQEDDDFDLDVGDEKDDEATLSEEEKLAKAESNDSMDEISLLQQESEIPVEELLANYHGGHDADESADDDSNFTSAYSEEEDAPNVNPKEEGKESEARIADAAASARSAQPTGNTFSTTKVRTKFPFLLKHSLREYQHIGLDWLVTMYEKRLNGILADEMGLGKTIMTIALLAHLACEKGIWGPHLIVVPTSVMLNWETEFLKWCPAFKILTYFGSAKERKLKRQGWLKPNCFHVCITTYRLVIQDSKIFKRKKWKYLILDEAHLIKNWRSQRWQTLLNFYSKRRILLTGTPLQNDLMELWSLMHFLMPHIFQSHQEFKDWFCNPISGMVEGQEKINKEVVDRLHNVLRPFILRRLKRDVEKQLPMKYEHVIYCRLSRRQRNLYEDFIASSETQATLASANFFGMISVIMQLRKVCNHPDLFEGRPIISSFDMDGIDILLSSSICSMLSPGAFSAADLRGLGFLFTHLDFSMASWECDEVKAIATPSSLIKVRFSGDILEEGCVFRPPLYKKTFHGTSIFHEIRNALLDERLKQARERAASIAWWNSLKCQKKPIYSTNLRKLVTVKHPVNDIHHQKGDPSSHLYCSSKLAAVVLSLVERFKRMVDQVEGFMFAIPAARSPLPVCWCRKRGASVFLNPAHEERFSEILSPLLSPIRPAIVRRQVYFPDRRLIQFDCGKLQELAVLLRRLKSEGHRALIFTQMTKMLDILEAFINLYGYTYMRLDGSTLPEARQTLMQRFNTNPKFFIFILSTRSGGVGINLVGADTVIFYDSDWNPAMDQQAQDRCHRIGQTREVHIYRLISESTIEENILKKANQKRALDDLVIQSGGYNTEFFKKLDPMELFSGHSRDKSNDSVIDAAFSNADVEAALKNVEDEVDYMALKKVEEEEAVENQEFTEEAIGRTEEDELLNEDEWKGDDTAEPACWGSSSNKDHTLTSCLSGPNEEGALALTNQEDDIDMLDDIRQITEVTMDTGQEIISFEDQLRPIDRYAMRFLELWDPIVDKAAMESEVNFEESEWELGHIEKLKEDMEAEIDDDEEPFVYERWDADFATEAYRQQVEALTQHQLIEELENEARERDADVENYNSKKTHGLADHKPKSKKKPKKTKFKFLKKGTLALESRTTKEELQLESMSTDDEFTIQREISTQKKRKKVDMPRGGEESIVARKFKKPKKAAPECDSGRQGPHADYSEDLKLSESTAVYIEPKSASKSRLRGTISITNMPVKRVLTIKPEKSRKKGSMWSKDCFPSPDSWLPQEDAILCAVVHEYGPHWSLVSEMLYGMTAGGFYRGRYRHPIHCCERFRELVQKYLLSTIDHQNNEKASNAVSGKGFLKVTEDNLRILLEVASEPPDGELLLQKHFTALLSSIWRLTSQIGHQKIVLPSGIGFHISGNISQTPGTIIKESPEKNDSVCLGKSSRLVAAALHDAGMKRSREGCSPSLEMQEAQASTEQVEITLEFPRVHFNLTNEFPSHLNLVIFGSDLPHSVETPMPKDYPLKSSGEMAENRFREASRTCEDFQGWASSTFSSHGKSLLKSRPSGGRLKPLAYDSTAKTSKSKLKRVSMESGYVQSLNNELPFFQLLLTDGNAESWCDEDDFLPLQYEEHGFGFISDLDDCSLSHEFTDFG